MKKFWKWLLWALIMLTGLSSLIDVAGSWLTADQNQKQSLYYALHGMSS